MASLQKEGRTRLTGKAMKKLNEDIHERDDCRCVACKKAYVPIGKKFHHEPCGDDKQDLIEQGACLCDKCHDIRHSRGGSLEIRKKAEDYLADLYPEHWENMRRTS